jgi:hypothetical protein
MLLKKKKKAIHGLNTTQENFDELSTAISEDTQNRWLRQEADALVDTDGFQIYDVDIEKGLSLITFILTVNNRCQCS